MKDYKNFTARALSWAAENPDEMVKYESNIPKPASEHEFLGSPWSYIIDEGEELIWAIESFELEKDILPDMTPLPYEFDLLYDIKYMYEVEMVCEGKCPAGTSATPGDLHEMFVRHSMAVPKYLEDAAGCSPISRTIWIGIDGSWITYQPLPDEAHKYVAARVTLTQEFIKALEVRSGRDIFDND